MTSASNPPSDVDRPDVGVKRARRSELLAARRAVPAADVAAASRRIVATLRSLPELAPAARPGAGPDALPGRAAERNLLLYAADPDEVDLSELLAAPPQGFRVLLPRVERSAEGDELVTVRHGPGDELVVGPLGVREPTGPAVDPTDVDVVIVPGVAFSPSGGRLGRGRGMYDRFLPRLPRAVRIGVCIEQLVVADLVLERHDARMDLLVTDASVRRRTASVPDAPA